MLILGVMLSCFSGVLILLTRQNDNTVFAEETAIEKPITVRKIESMVNQSTYFFRYDDNGNIDLDNLTKQSSVNGGAKDIRNNELILLDRTSNTKDVVMVSFNLGEMSYEMKDGSIDTSSVIAQVENQNVTYYTLQVNAYLNNRPIMTNETIKDQDATASKYYYQVLDLDTSSTNVLNFKDGTKVDNIEGEYRFVFEYTRKENDIVYPTETRTISFYVYNQETYSNSDARHIEPRLFNTERIERANFDTTGATEYNYFNYNNLSTTGYDRTPSSSTEKLLFPTIDYDITKYSLRFKASLYGSYDIYEYIFDGFDAKDNPLLSVYKNGESINTSVSTNNGLTTIKILDDDRILNDITIFQNIASVKLSSIAEYDFTFNYVVNKLSYNSATGTYSSTYLINSQLTDGYNDNDITFVKQTNWNRVGDVKLFLFGYQLFCSDYASLISSSREFTDGNEFTDVTFLNDKDNFAKDFALNEQNVITADNNPLTIPVKAGEVVISSTNQAPVTMEYYANMTLENNKTKSYYKYWSNIQSYVQGDIPTVSDNITNNTRFTQNGYYQIYIEYNFASYRQYNSNNHTFIDNPDQINHYQYFSFAINNSEPTISVSDISGNAISTNGYTNQDVQISWSANSVFDISPRIQILRQSFDDLQAQNGKWLSVYNNNNQNVDDYGIILTGGNTLKITTTPIENKTVDTNGYYQIIINYGPGSHTFAKYRFTIDREQIDGITSYAITNQDASQIAFEETSLSTLNSAFALSWNEKKSNSSISATYSFVALEKNDSLLESNLSLLPTITSSTDVSTIMSALDSMKQNSKSLNLLSGYQLAGTINQNIPYAKAEIQTITTETETFYTLKDINSMRASAGFYIFTLQDSAGNIAHKVVFVDSTTPSVYSFTNEQDSYVLASKQDSMIASRNTILIWGDNKALQFDSENASVNAFIQDVNTFAPNEFNITTNQVLIPTNNVSSVDSSNIEGGRYTNQIAINNNYQMFYIKYTAEQRQELEQAQTDALKQAVINKYWNYSEHIHTVSVNNANEITSTANKVFNNTSVINLEMNGDNSLLMAYVSDGENAKKADRLQDTMASNKSSLYIEWIQNEGNNFEVKDISVYYYPLNFDETSSNYPYASSPESNFKLDLENAVNSSINSNKKISTAINLENGQSLEGMYLVRREYVSPLEIGTDDNISDDYSPRYYLFFIDRNEIISYTSSLHLLGEKIGLKIGTDQAYRYSNYQVEFAGSDFLTDTNQANPKFRTSKLPVLFTTEIASLNKFSSNSQDIVTNPDEQEYVLGNETTGYKINNQIVQTFKLNSPKISYKEKQSDKDFKTLETADFTKNGIYKVELSDKAQNTYSFIFQIAVETPRANVAKYIYSDNIQKNEYLFYTEGEQNISTNQKNMIIAWNKPAGNSGFDAEIDLYNFSLKAKFENGKNATFTVQNGVLSSSLTLPRTATLQIRDISTDELKANSLFSEPTWDYYLDFADLYKIMPVEYASQSVNFEITLKYVGFEQDYANLTTVTPNKYFYTIKNIVFDFNKPQYNYSRLVSSDLYLTNFYDTTSEQALEDFKNQFGSYSQDVNFENYAFVVDKNFTINQMVLPQNSIWTDSNMDTYKMYIRQYNKYQDDTIQNQQSLVPDDDRYDNRALYPNRYRFDENYMSNGQLLYTNISEYYWNDNEHKDYTLEYIINKFGWDYNTYYEIIEVDFAGNYRVYTLFVKEDLTQSISSATLTGTDTASGATQEINKNFTAISKYSIDGKQVNLVLANAQLDIVNSLEFEKAFAKQLTFDSFADNLDEFVKKYISVSINDINLGSVTTFYYAPNQDLDAFFEQINQAISAYNSETGNIYYITITTSLGEVLKIEHRKPSATYPEYTISSTSTGFTITFTVNPNDANSSAYFTSFNAYQAENGQINTLPLDKDSNGNTIVSEIEKYLENNNLSSYTFRYTFTMRGSSGSEYFIKLTDNFGRELTIRRIIGVEDNQDKIVFASPNENILTLDAFEKNGTTQNAIKISYTNGYATIKYQNILNTLKVYRCSLQNLSGDYILTAGDKLTLDDKLFTKSINGIWTYPLITQDTDNDSIFKIVFTSTQGEEVYYVGYHNTLGSINIVNASDNSKVEVSQGLKATYDKTIFLSINNVGELFPTMISGIREYVNQNNEIVKEYLGNITSGQVFNQLGTYTFTAYNELGSTLTFTVKIEEKITNNYWINYKINGLDAGTLTPAKQDKTNPAEYGSINNPISFFTIYDYELKTNTTNGYYFSLVEGSTITEEFNGAVVGTTSIYKIYRLVGEETKDEVYISISKVIANSNFVRNYGNSLSINSRPQTSNETKITPNAQTNIKTALVELANSFNILQQNSIILSYTYNGTFIKELYLNSCTEEDLTFIDSGVYDLYFTDLAGNKQMFGNNSYFRMYLLNDIIFNVNAKQSVNNAVYNGQVTISLEQVQQFDNAQVNIVAKRNGNEIRVSKVNNTFTFTEYGLYQVTLSGKINGNVVSTDYTFRIININEAMTTFEYVGLNNYEIVKVIKLDSKQSEEGDDITEYLKQAYGDVNSLSSIALSTLENGIGGAGIYEIFVEARYTSNKIDQAFSFKVWLNSDNDILIKCSIKYGDTTTKPITLTLNKNQIFNKIGECKIYLNSTEWIDINAETAAENKAESFTINQTGVYNVRIISASGNTLSSFIITKNEPLNAVAIIVIVISIIAVGVVVFIFIRLRKNMKVK